MVGGWGRGARELVLASAGDVAESVGELALAGVEGGGEGRWRCWLAGRLSNAGELVRRFAPDEDGSVSAALAAAYELEGQAAGDLPRGTFVLLALDRERGVATVARDHLGGRPLVYARIGAGVLFAEHEREILALLARTPGPDRLAVQHWLERGGVSERSDPVRGRLPPAARAPVGADGGSGRGRALLAARTIGGTPPYDREEAAERPAGRGLRRRRRGLRGRSRSRSGSAAASTPPVSRPAWRRARRVRAGRWRWQPSFPEQEATDERDLIEATAPTPVFGLEQVAFEGPATLLDPARRHIERWRLPPGSPNLFVWEPIAALARELGASRRCSTGRGATSSSGLLPT